MKSKNHQKAIVQRIMQCTPEELQKVLTVIHSWEQDFGDELAGEVETVQEIVDILQECVPEIENSFGYDYFKEVFGI